MKASPRRSLEMMEKLRPQVPTRESSRVIWLEVMPPYLLAGLGMMAAGMLLDRVQVREVNCLK